jgi:hypothetical protein
MPAPVRSIGWSCFESLEFRAMAGSASVSDQYDWVLSSAHAPFSTPRSRVVTLALDRLVPVGCMLSKKMGAWVIIRVEVLGVCVRRASSSRFDVVENENRAADARPTH